MIIESAMRAYLFGSLALDKLQFLLFSTAEERVFEDQHFVVLFDLMKVIHVQLPVGGNRTQVEEIGTCRTKEEKLECLKYLGSISLVKLRGSSTMKPIQSLSQQIIFLFSGCYFLQMLLPGSRMSSEGRRQWYHCSCLSCAAVATPSPLILLYTSFNQMSNLGLTIRIPKETIIRLNEMQGKQIVVKFSGGREVSGTLLNYDKPMNLILENTQEILGVENGAQISRPLGLIIVKGTQIQTISLKDGYEVIDNPYAEGGEDN